MPQFCHYTDDDGAEKIIKSGKIMVSLESSGDAAYGNGVYLTKLNPNNPGSLTRAQVAQNNWSSNSDDSLKKTKNLFVLEIPDKKVKNFSFDTRNIFVFGGRKDLPLVKFKWYLQNFDSGKILASHKYHIGSTGPASATLTRFEMGDYVMTEKRVNGWPVYKKTWSVKTFLFMGSSGRWTVGSNTDKDRGWLRQKDNYTHYYSLGPGAEVAWDYGGYDADGKLCWKGDDDTLKAHPWYKRSPWKTIHHNDSRIDPVSPTTATSNTPAATASTGTSSATTITTTATNPAITSSTTNPAITTTATNPAITTTAPGTASISVKALVHTTPAPATSSNVPDPDNDKGLQSPGTTPSGRVYGGPPGKTTGLFLMLFLFVLLVLLFVFGFRYYTF